MREPGGDAGGKTTNAETPTRSILLGFVLNALPSELLCIMFAHQFRADRD
jgi:hypothetical protein